MNDTENKMNVTSFYSLCALKTMSFSSPPQSAESRLKMKGRNIQRMPLRKRNDKNNIHRERKKSKNKKFEKRCLV